MKRLCLVILLAIGYPSCYLSNKFGAFRVKVAQPPLTQPLSWHLVQSSGVNRFVMAQVNRLSKREQEVVDHLLQGKTNKQIALILGISQRTVEFHLKNVYAKYAVSSRVEFILKVGKSTGVELGKSTVDNARKNTENRDRLNSRLKWTVASVKKRWSLYSLAGLVFGAGYWHYLNATAHFFNGVDSNIPDILLLVHVLMVYLGIWLFPAILHVIYEFHRSPSITGGENEQSKS
jgi:DNA-binding CsgD family transcriptional regulator